MRLTSLAVFSLLFAGCMSMYGTPVERQASNQRSSSLSLCRAQLAPAPVREEWALELQRRGENCSQYAALISSQAQADQEQLKLGLQLLSPPLPPPPPAPTGLVGGSSLDRGTFVRSVVSGANRICYYNRMGSAVVITIPSLQFCPL